MPRLSYPVARRHGEKIRVRWKGKEKQFGRWDDPTAWERFEAWKATILQVQQSLIVDESNNNNNNNNNSSMAWLVDKYLDHARSYYRYPDGSTTSEYREILAVMSDLLQIIGTNLPASEFAPDTLKSFRARLIDRNLCRPVINQRIGRIQRMFDWAAAETSVIAPEQALSLRTRVRPLPRGRSQAHEPPDIEPVSDDVVNATLPFLGPVVRKIVEFQRGTGCRPDEACRLRAIDIDRTEDVWVYSPTCPHTGRPRHKTAWRDKIRAILIGPSVQAWLGPLLEQRHPDEFVFRPSDTPFARATSPRYTAQTYGRAIARSIQRENDRRRAIAAADQQAGLRVEPVLIPHWTPLQVRHSALTKWKELVGWRVAQEVAGHGLEATTRGYVAERLPLAMQAVRKFG